MKTFPMFLQLQNRTAVVIGAGEQALQKVRLLLKTEARVLVAGSNPVPEMTSLAAMDRVCLIGAEPDQSTLVEAAVVFIATGCRAADHAWHAIAKDAGALVNVVDNPLLCDVITPALVDRDPVVVAIGTEGTAPVLARQIKTRIEQLLEPELGALATMAGAARDLVSANVPRDQRRAFWEWAFTGAPLDLVSSGDARGAADAMRNAAIAGGSPTTSTGRISVMACTGGTPDLLTQRAVRRLQTADIIVCDPAEHASVLELARRDAQRVETPRHEHKLRALIQQCAEWCDDGQSVVWLTQQDQTARKTIESLRAINVSTELLVDGTYEQSGSPIALSVAAE